MSNKNEILNCCYLPKVEAKGKLMCVFSFKTIKSLCKVGLSVHPQTLHNKLASWQDKLDEALRYLKVFFFSFENLIFKEDKGTEQLKINSFSFIIHVLISTVYSLCVLTGEMDEWGRGHKEISISGRQLG